MSKSEVGRIILTMKKCDYHVIKGTKLIHSIDLKVLPLHARGLLAIPVWCCLMVEINSCWAVKTAQMYLYTINSRHSQMIFILLQVSTSKCQFFTTLYP